MTLPASYLDSRAAFVRAANALQAKLGAHSHGARESGIELTTDVAVLGPADADTVVVIASGTHGVEGYAGAACQLRFMQRYKEHFAERGIAFVLVHAVNPWGYFHDRRVTLENVDLNRNFIDFPVIDHDSGYGAYHDRLVTHFRPSRRGWWNEALLLASAALPQRRRRLQAAITAGQYAHANGLFYGGREPTASRRTWEDIVRAHVVGRRRAVLLDIHTGLGERGKGELISYLPPSSSRFQTMNAWFEGQLKSMAGGESVSTAVEGTLTAGFDRMATGASYAIGLEFGTCSPLAVLNAMREDQWYRNHAHALTSDDRERARRKMKNAFAPGDARWYGDVIARFDDVMEKLCGGQLA